MKNILKLKQKIVFILGLFICSFSSFSQTVDVVANVDAFPPLEVGDTFSYTLQAVAGTTPYRVVQVYLNYNTSAIQLNSFTPDNTDLDAIQTIISEPGVIKYSAGSLTNDVTGTTTVFTVIFEVVGTAENIMITHDIASDGNPNGTGVGNTSGQDILGTANDIILATLATEENTFNANISVFPNPVSDVMYIKTNTVSNIKDIKIHTLDGKLIQQIKNKHMEGNQIAIPIKHLEEALYFVTITSAQNEIARFKVLIQN